jgi:hypothetical protein
MVKSINKWSVKLKNYYKINIFILKDSNYIDIKIMTQKFLFSINGKNVSIPYRIYKDPIDTSDFEYIYMMTRHSDGYIREKFLKKILASDNLRYEATPFIVLLIGEYIIEILEIIEKNDRIYPYLDLFFRENQSYYLILKSKIISYWNEYYRDRFPNFKDYVGSKIILRLENMNSNLIKKMKS